MAHRNHFAICNDSLPSLILNIEPEGAFFALAKGEEVSVTDVYTVNPVTVRLTTSDKGEPIVSIWPGDGEVRVEKEEWRGRFRLDSKGRGCLTRQVSDAAPSMPDDFGDRKP